MQNFLFWILGQFYFVILIIGFFSTIYIVNLKYACWLVVIMVTTTETFLYLLKINCTNIQMQICCSRGSRLMWTQPTYTHEWCWHYDCVVKISIRFFFFRLHRIDIMPWLWTGMKFYDFYEKLYVWNQIIVCGVGSVAVN